MSKLDDILDIEHLLNEYTAEVKREIKDLMLELIGKDLVVWPTESAGSKPHVCNLLKAQLRKKVEEL